MDWAAWGPTIVSLITAIFIAGMMYGKIKDHDGHLAKHDVELDTMLTRLNFGEIEIAKLQAWRDGYNAAACKSCFEQEHVK
jgi:hypothetical protein